MLNKKEVTYTWEEKNGSKVFAKEVSGVEKSNKMTVAEFAKFLNDLVAAGYGDYKLEADTQDGDSYDVRNEVLAFDLSKTVKIF